MINYLGLFLHIMKKPNMVPVPIFSEAMPVDTARNELAKHALLAHANLILWLDSDIILTPSGFDALLKTVEMGNDFVSGIYYERAPPFNPVLRKEAPFNKMQPIYEYPPDQLFEVDGAGFGCVLMTDKALKAVFGPQKGEPFKFSKECSEDLFFCRRLREQGFKLIANPEAQCSHIGASVSAWHYLHHKRDEYQDVIELAKYLKQSPETTLQKCMDAPFHMLTKWTATFAKKEEKDITAEELDKFYKDYDYLHDLTFYWSRHKTMTNLIFERLPHDEKMVVLDFGCGIGDYGLNVLLENEKAFVVFYDINDKNLNYLRDRVKRRGLQDRCVVTDSLELAMSHKEFDAIFCLDVLEHVKDPAKVTEMLRNSLKRNGLFFGFVAEASHFMPQHINSEFKLEDHGLVRFFSYGYVRNDSDVAAAHQKNIATITGDKDGNKT
jgi:2-polyprenyl-3-methyl-5-hydroxy-6-metoxy-1,4-benzoquinol methylase